MIKVFAEGIIAQDAKIFNYGKNGSKEGVSFGVFCNKYYGDENATYIQCTYFNRGESLASKLTKGRRITVVGNLNRNEEGYYSVTIDDLSLGIDYHENSRGNENRTSERGSSNRQYNPNDFDDELPFN